MVRDEEPHRDVESSDRGIQEVPSQHREAATAFEQPAGGREQVRRQSHLAKRLFLVLLLNLGVSVPRVIAQPNADASDSADRQKAAALFGQGKRLEALPLLEGLVQKNPNDDEMLVALAASLI